jgi:hypothetical protein
MLITFECPYEGPPASDNPLPDKLFWSSSHCMWLTPEQKQWNPQSGKPKPKLLPEQVRWLCPWERDTDNMYSGSE